MNYHKERPTLEGQPAQVAATGLSSGQRRVLMEAFADKGTLRRNLDRRSPALPKSAIYLQDI